jgi:hypothetical protein
MDAEAERVYAGARLLLQRCKDKYGVHALPDEIFQIQDVLECIEKNADRIAHMMKDPRRKRTGESWDDIKGLLAEQDRYFKEVGLLHVSINGITGSAYWYSSGRLFLFRSLSSFAT